jgi:hypothetical protein
MTTFIPKNARKILSNPALQKDYFLKPFGLDVNLFIIRFQKIRIFQKNILNINTFNIK